MQYNYTSGSIPLDVVSLIVNNYSGHLDIPRRVNLQRLDLETSNGITSINLNNVPWVEHLYASNTEIEYIDLSRLIHLSTFSCKSSMLKSIDVTNCINLVRLELANTQISELVIDLPHILFINLSGCHKLRSIELHAPLLMFLNLYMTSVGELNLDDCPNLRNLYVGYTMISDVNAIIAACKDIEVLDIRNTFVTSLDISNLKCLETLYTAGCANLMRIYARNSSVASIYCNTSISLRYLDVSTCMNLTHLDCSYCSLDHLLVPPTVQKIHCNNNRLITLNLEHCRELEFVNCSKNKIVHISIIDANIPHLYASSNSYGLHILISNVFDTIIHMARKAIIARRTKRWYDILCQIDSRPSGVVGIWDKGGNYFQEAIDDVQSIILDYDINGLIRPYTLT